jgi:hypothetical protein
MYYIVRQVFKYKLIGLFLVRQVFKGDNYSREETIDY